MGYRLGHRQRSERPRCPLQIAGCLGQRRLGAEQGRLRAQQISPALARTPVSGLDQLIERQAHAIGSIEALLGKTGNDSRDFAGRTEG